MKVDLRNAGAQNLLPVPRTPDAPATMIRIFLATFLIFSLARAEQVSVTFTDEVGEGHPTGDLQTARVFWDAGAPFTAVEQEYEAAPGGNFSQAAFTGWDSLLVGGTLLNISELQRPPFRSPWARTRMPEPQPVLTFSIGTNNPGWAVGDKIAAHYGYGFTSANIDLPDDFDCHLCKWLFGVHGLLGQTLGDELDTPFSSFAIVSRHVRVYSFGSIARDDQGTLFGGVLYFRSRSLGNTVANATGPLVEALGTEYDFDAFADPYYLSLETNAGIPSSLDDRGGFLARLGFPLRDAPDPSNGGRFIQFFFQPKDLFGARYRVKLSEQSDTDLVEVRFVIADSNGAQVATAPFRLDGTEQDLKARTDDFLFPLTDGQFDQTQVVDFWLEFFSYIPDIQDMPATQLVIRSAEVEVRQPKVRVLPDDYLLGPGERTRVSWRSADADVCIGTGMLEGVLPTNGSVLVSHPGDLGVGCSSANTQTVDAADSVTIRHALRSVSFDDPTGDTARGFGNGDIIGTTLKIAEGGWYQVTISANPEAPFGPGPLSSSIRFINGDIEPFDEAIAVFDVKDEATLIDFYIGASTPRLVLSGVSSKLIDWHSGSRITVEGGLAGFVSNIDFGLDADGFCPGTFVELSDAVEQPLFVDGFEEDPPPPDTAPLIIDEAGHLLGSSSVFVNGEEYEIRFEEGTCAEIYDGCDSPDDLPFQTREGATAAASALLEQVFLDGPFGNFDSDPTLTYGCHFDDPPTGCTVDLHSCTSWTPYLLLESRVAAPGSINHDANDQDSLTENVPLYSFDTRLYQTINWVTWEKKSVSIR